MKNDSHRRWCSEQQSLTNIVMLWFLQGVLQTVSGEARSKKYQIYQILVV